MKMSTTVRGPANMTQRNQCAHCADSGLALTSTTKYSVEKHVREIMRNPKWRQVDGGYSALERELQIAYDAGKSEVKK